MIVVARSAPSEREVRTLRARAWAEQAWARRRDPLCRAEAALLTVLAAAIFGFAHIAEDYLTRDPLVRWDVSFAAWLHAHATHVLTRFFEVVTLAGNVAVLAALTAVATLVLLRRGAGAQAVLLGATALGIEVLNGALKLAFQRPRPELAYVHLDTYSFPSGHAAGSAAIYGVLALLLARRGLWGRVACAAGYVLIVAAVGFSRLYLEAHYLSDVLAGLCVGVAWLAACLLVYERQRRACRSGGIVSLPAG